MTYPENHRLVILTVKGQKYTGMSFAAVCHARKNDLSMSQVYNILRMEKYFKKSAYNDKNYILTYSCGGIVRGWSGTGEEETTRGEGFAVHAVQEALSTGDKDTTELIVATSLPRPVVKAAVKEGMGRDPPYFAEAKGKYHNTRTGKQRLNRRESKRKTVSEAERARLALNEAYMQVDALREYKAKLTKTPFTPLEHVEELPQGKALREKGAVAAVIKPVLEMKDALLKEILELEARK